MHFQQSVQSCEFDRNRHGALLLLRPLQLPAMAAAVDQIQQVMESKIMTRFTGLRSASIIIAEGDPAI